MDRWQHGQRLTASHTQPGEEGEGSRKEVQGGGGEGGDGGGRGREGAHTHITQIQVTYGISARQGVFLDTNLTLLSAEDLVYSYRGGEENAND